MHCNYLLQCENLECVYFILTMAISKSVTTRGAWILFTHSPNCFPFLCTSFRTCMNFLYSLPSSLLPDCCVFDILCPVYTDPSSALCKPSRSCLSYFVSSSLNLSSHSDNKFPILFLLVISCMCSSSPLLHYQLWLVGQTLHANF